MSSMEFDKEKVDETMNFNVLHKQITNLLVHNSLKLAIKGQNTAMLIADCKGLDERALFTIHLCLSNAVM